MGKNFDKELGYLKGQCFNIAGNILKREGKSIQDFWKLFDSLFDSAIKRGYLTMEESLLKNLEKKEQESINKNIENKNNNFPNPKDYPMPKPDKEGMAKCPKCGMWIKKGFREGYIWQCRKCGYEVEK